MASSTKRPAILLEEKDVPGSVLPNEKCINANNVMHLKRWLQCRGLPVTGKKEILVERVQNCRNTRNGTGIDPAIDGGVWYEKKRARVATTTGTNTSDGCLASNEVVFPVLGWKSFPSFPIPRNFCYGIMYEFFVTSVLTEGNNENTEGRDSSDNEEEGSFDTSKPLKRGRIYFKSGHVQNLHNCKTKDGYYCLKADVYASYRKTSYKTMVMLHKETAHVVDSACQCAASALGRCNHVAGLLFALEDYVTLFGYDVASTSRLCQWNVGRQQKNPAAIMERQYTNKHDPNVTFNFTPINVSGMKVTEVANEFLGEFQTNKTENRWQYLLDFQYEDYQLTAERRSELVEYTKAMQKSLQFNNNGPLEISDTKGQCNNERWKNLRWFFHNSLNV